MSAILVSYRMLIYILVLLCLMPSMPAFAEEKPPAVSSESVVLMDATTGQILYEKNMHEKRFPASVTKIMTGILALELGQLDNTVTLSNRAVFSIEYNSSHIALNEGEEISLKQALYALAVSSANDAANGIAEHIGGSLENFAELMSKKAALLGTKNTNFSNAHGLPDPNHYTTAYDMGLIMMHAVKNPTFLQLFSEKRYEIQPSNMQKETRYLNSSNPLINGAVRYEGILASKNGWTSEANHTLVTAAKRGNRKLITVVMNNKGQEQIVADTKALLDYGFNEFYEFTVQVEDDVEELLSGLPDLQNSNIAESSHVGTVTRLLHKSITEQDLQKSIKKLHVDGLSCTLQFSLDLRTKQAVMYGSIGEFLVTVENPSAPIRKKAVLGQSILRFFLICTGLVFLLRMRVYIKRRRRRSRLIRARVYRYRGY